MLIEIKSKEQLTELLNTDKPVMVDFYANWCGPCKMAMPHVEWLANTYEGEYVVAKVEVDENPDLAKEYEIMSIPAFRFFKNGQLVDQMPPKDIRRRVMEEKLNALR